MQALLLQLVTEIVNHKRNTTHDDIVVYSNMNLSMRGVEWDGVFPPPFLPALCPLPVE